MQRLLGHADAVVAEVEHQLTVLDLACADDDFWGGIRRERVQQGVVDQVRQHLSQAARIRIEHQLRRHVDVDDAIGAAQLGGVGGDGVAHHRAENETASHVAGLVDRHLLERRDQAGRPAQRAGHDVARQPGICHVRFERRALDAASGVFFLELGHHVGQRGGGQQAVADRRIEFVRDAGHQRAERGQFFGRDQAGLRLLERHQHRRQVAVRQFDLGLLPFQLGQAGVPLVERGAQPPGQAAAAARGDQQRGDQGTDHHAGRGDQHQRRDVARVAAVRQGPVLHQPVALGDLDMTLRHQPRQGAGAALAAVEQRLDDTCWRRQARFRIARIDNVQRHVGQQRWFDHFAHQVIDAERDRHHADKGGAPLRHRTGRHVPAVDRNARHEAGLAGCILHQQRAPGRGDLAAVARRLHRRAMRRQTGQVQAERALIALHRLVELDDEVLVAGENRMDRELRRVVGLTGGDEAGQFMVRHRAHELDRAKAGIALAQSQRLDKAGELRAIDVTGNREQALEAEQHVEIDAQACAGVGRDFVGIAHEIAADLGVLGIHHDQAGPDGDADADHESQVTVEPNRVAAQAGLGQVVGAAVRFQHGRLDVIVHLRRFPCAIDPDHDTACARNVSGFLQFPRAIDC